MSLYLYLYFGAIILYKTSILREQGVDFAPWGVAVLKALVIGKFVLLGESMRIGHLSRGEALIWHVLHKVVAFIILLYVLTCIEDVAVALLHGHSFREGLATVSAKPWQEVAAMSLLGALALAPFFGVQEIARTMGAENFRRLLLARRS